MHETLRLKNICSGLLHDISFSVPEAEVSAALDYSETEIQTLLQILEGTCTEYGGTIFTDGSPVRLNSVQDHQQSGIFCVGSTNILIPNLTIKENIGLVDPLGKSFVVDDNKASKISEYVLDRFQIHVRPDTYPNELTAYERHDIEIFKAINLGARVIVLCGFFEYYSLEERIRLGKRMQLLTTLGITVLVLLSRQHPEWEDLFSKVILLQDGLTGVTIPPQQLNSYNGFPVSQNDINSEFNSSYCILSAAGETVLRLTGNKVNVILDYMHLIPESEYEIRERFQGIALQFEEERHLILPDACGKDRVAACAYYNPDHLRLLRNLSVCENICIQTMRILSDCTKINEDLDQYLAETILNLHPFFRELKEHIDDKDCSQLNPLEIKEIEMARAIVTKPAFLLVLMSGMQDSNQKTNELYQLFHILCKKDITVIAVLHDATELPHLKPDNAITL